MLHHLGPFSFSFFFVSFAFCLFISLYTMNAKKYSIRKDHLRETILKALRYFQTNIRIVLVYYESEKNMLKGSSNILGLTFASYFAETIYNYSNINLTLIKRRKRIDIGNSSTCPSPSCSEMAPFCLKQQRTAKITIGATARLEQKLSVHFSFST